MSPESKTGGAREASPTPSNPLPSPTLPKGGGAIRSIGEKFSANPATGAGSLSVPIFVSPSRGGFQPELSLQYDSGSGNSPFGIGWSLSVPRVTRKTDKGLPRYSDGESFDSDTFILSGAEDLVPLLTNVAGQWVRLPLTDTDGPDTFDVVRYRPRVDGLYARIERWTRRRDGDVHWRSTTQNYLTSIYGQSATARIADPARPDHVFSWLLEKTLDHKGNLVLYGYKSEDQANIDAAVANEAIRPVANAYLKTISYANQTPDDDSACHFQVLFDYGDENPTEPQQPQPIWPGRQDSFSDFRSTFEVRTYRLCRNIFMRHHFDVLGTGWIIVRSMALQYDENPIATRLTGIQGFGWTQTGGVYDAPLPLPAINCQYSLPTIEPTLHTIDPQSLANLPSGIDETTYQLIDFDGEGLPGVLTQQGGALFYKRSDGDGQFDSVRVLATKPSLADLGGGQQLSDIDGSGNKFLVQLGREPQGYFERRGGSWDTFHPFKLLPDIAWGSDGLKYVDLDGDGLPDVLKPEGELYRWWPSLGRDGYGSERRVTLPRDDRQAPYVVWRDPKQAVLLADMTGDGLSDVVRISNGAVCYWPNRGYGRFGAQVVMRNPPRFSSTDEFNPAYLRLADVDGSGTADLLYLGDGVARIWLNQSGNGYGLEQRVPFPSPVDNNVTVTDFLGKGTACLVWSSPLPGNRGSQLRYLDLMSGIKPHLLLTVTNNLGATTTITYRPSTEYYLADRRAGLPWVTKLPFPMQVVAMVEVDESVTGTQIVTTYQYHHGHYDGVEREFAGFGMVEQTDAETLVEGATTFAYTPPKLTKTWFHTGAFFDAETVSTQYAREYSGDFPQLVPDSLLPPLVPPEQMREAARALRGHQLRQEVYGLDGSALAPHPYVIFESNFQVRWLQPRATNRYGSFDVIPREMLTVHTERNAADPRREHELTLNVDVYGNVVEGLHIAYARNGADPTSAQAETLITDAQVDYVNIDDATDNYRVGLVRETRKYQLTGVSEPALEDTYSFAEAQALLTATRTLFEQMRMIYLGDSPADNSQLALGLVIDTHRAAFPDTLFQTVYGGLAGAPSPTLGGYLNDGTMWWAPTGQIAYLTGQFYLPNQFTDPYGTISSVAYDAYSLLPLHAYQASNVPSHATTTSFSNDYRVLATSLITDSNLNQMQVSFDGLGRVWQTWIKGKVTESVGDDAAHPSTVVEYHTDVVPAYVKVTKREQHYLTDPTNTKALIAYSYTDGLGREVLSKKQAQPDASGNPRWTGTGRTVFDNKGNPVQKFEPYFSANPDYEVVINGVSDLLTYDPLNRVVRTDHPDGSYSRVQLGELVVDVFTPNAWGQLTYDENDTVGEAGNTWYAVFRTGTADQIDAAKKALAHTNTPTRTHVDPLGRTYLTEQDNGGGALYATTQTLDLQGNPLVVTDARGVAVATTTFDLLKRSLKVSSPDSGTQTSLPDVTNKAIYEWTANGAQVARSYDALRRPLAVTVTEATGSRIVERTFYGEPITGSESANLKGKIYRQLDGAGLVTHSAYDFKGNLLTSSRQLAATYDFSKISWPALADLTTIDPTWLPAGGASSESFSTSIAYDALNRQTRIEMDRTDGTSDVAVPGYNETGLLSGITVQVAGAVNPSAYVTRIDYNEKEQRLSIAYGNGVSTVYTYEPTTFRLSTLQTTKSTTGDLQSLGYTYDPIGNITTIEDTAQQTLYVGNSQIKPTTTYTYDATYRLTNAGGREHITQSTPDQTFAPPWIPLPNPNDSTAMRNYAESYQYDDVGNFIAMVHAVTNSTGQYQNLWTRTYTTDSASNRLQQTILGNGTTTNTKYIYDDNVPNLAGNITSMGTITLVWNYKNQLTQATTSQGTSYFQYDTAGQRVRKTLIPATGNITLSERFYLNGYELYRDHTTSATIASLERRTLNIVDNKRTIALIELLTIGNDGSPTQLVRYQLDNHLGSAVLELDAAATTISYEEYHPYGTTAYRAGESVLDTNPKRYAFTGKERDDETGLSYHGARYYACWLGRWTSADPQTLVDGTNAFRFVGNNPVRLVDLTGFQGEVPQLQLKEPDLAGAVQQKKAPTLSVGTLSLAPPIPKLLRQFEKRFPEAGALIETLPHALDLIREAQASGAKFGGIAEEHLTKKELKDIGPRAFTRKKKVFIPRNGTSDHTDLPAPVREATDFLFELTNTLSADKFNHLRNTAKDLTNPITAEQFALQALTIEAQGTGRLADIYKQDLRDSVSFEDRADYDTEFYYRANYGVFGEKISPEQIAIKQFKEPYTAGGKSPAQLYSDEYRKLRKAAGGR